MELFQPRMSIQIRIKQLSRFLVIATLFSASNGHLQQDVESNLTVANKTAENRQDNGFYRSDYDESSATLVDRLSRLREARNERIRELQESVLETLENIRGKRAQPDTEVYKLNIDLPVEGPAQDSNSWIPITSNSSDADKQPVTQEQAIGPSVQYDESLDNEESRKAQSQTSGHNDRWIAIAPDVSWRETSQSFGRNAREIRTPPPGFSQPLDQTTSSDITDSSQFVVHQDPIEYQPNYGSVESNAQQDTQQEHADSQSADTTWPSEENEETSLANRESIQLRRNQQRQPVTLHSTFKVNQEQNYDDSSQKADNSATMLTEPKFKEEDSYGKRNNQLKSAESYDHASVEHQMHHHEDHGHHKEHEHHKDHGYHHGGHHEGHGHQHEGHEYHHGGHEGHHGDHEKHHGGHEYHHEDHGHHHEEHGAYEREDKIKCELEEKHPVKKEEKHHHYHHYHHHHHEPKEKHVVKVKEVKKVSQPVHLEIHIKGKGKGKGKKGKKKKKKGGEEVYIKIAHGDHKGEHGHGYEHSHEHGHEHSYGYGEKHEEGDGIVPKSEKGQYSLIEDKTSLIVDSDSDDNVGNNEDKASKEAGAATIRNSGDQKDESYPEETPGGDKGERTEQLGDVTNDNFGMREEKENHSQQEIISEKHKVDKGKEKKKKKEVVVEKEAEVEKKKSVVKVKKVHKKEEKKPGKQEEKKLKEPKVEQPIKEEPKKEEPKKEEPQLVELNGHEHPEHHQHKAEMEHHHEDEDLGEHNPELQGQQIHELPLDHQQHVGSHNIHPGQGFYDQVLLRGRLPIKEEWIVPEMIEKPVSEHQPHGGFVFEDHSELDRPFETGYTEEITSHPHGIGLTPSGVHGLMGLFSTPQVTRSTANKTIEEKVGPETKKESQR